LDEIKLQSYFDGELPLEQMESVTSHLASCATCAAAARELEEESALVMNALAAEFEASVPTEALRRRIDEAVLGDRLEFARSSAKNSGFFSGLFNFGTQRALGYASLAIVLAFGAIFAVVKMKSTPESNNDNVATVTAPPISVTPKVEDNTPAPIAANRPQDERPAIKVVSQPVRPARNPNFRPVSYTSTPASEELNAHPVKLLPGERAYLETIAKLDSTIKSGKKSMRPSLQVEYERNLAVVDRAIAATRSAAKSNPNDPDAADFMFSAYQSKVDLLNTIADARVGGGRGH
jgi:hypothetical protein